MKTIGLIGGLTWLSTLDYYRLLNQKVNEQLGGVEAAKIILYSVNFAEIKVLTEAGDWESISKMITNVAQHLQQAGADCILIGANTMHKIADEVQAAVAIPVIHIAEHTANDIASKNIKVVALLGTKYTMQLNFYTNKLSAEGITTIIPNEDDIAYINNAIYTEMSKGLFLDTTKERFIQIINELQEQGAEAIILGCTEIPILVKQSDVTIPLFDTTLIHVNAAIKFALQ